MINIFLFPGLQSYRLVDICELAILYILELDCDVLPVSMNGYFDDEGKEISNGCPGAVWKNGNPAQKYCEGKDWKGNEDVYPWWSKCCNWENNVCVAKGNIEQYSRS